MGIVKTGKIQTMGEPLGERYVKSLWFEQINSGTSGTLAPPAQAEIVLDQWSAGIDALASTISSGVPAFISPVTSGGVIVTATLDSSGNWTLSGTPSAYPVAIVYAYQVKFKFFDYTKQLGGYELIPAAGGVFTDVANFGGKLSSADTTVQKALDTLDDHAHSGVYLTPTEHTNIGDSSPHHAAVTLGAGAAELTLVGQLLTLAEVLTPTEHTAIGDSSPHHAAITLATGGDTLLGLSGQALDLDTQAANLGLFGPVSGDAAVPTFRSLVNADFPATLSPTLAGLGATPIITSYVGPHAIGGATIVSIQYYLLGSFTSPIGNVFGLAVSTTLTPGGTNKSAYGISGSPTLVMVAGQVHPVFATLGFNAPTVTSAAGASVTEATTVRIISAPTAGVSNYAFHVVAGASKFGALTASLPVVTNADKALASLAYTGATSFRKNLGLETDDSPTFVDLTLSGVLKIDDIQVISNRVVDATIDNEIEAAFTTLYPLASALLNGIRTAQKTHGLMAAA